MSILNNAVQQVHWIQLR